MPQIRKVSICSEIRLLGAFPPILRDSIWWTSESYFYSSPCPGTYACPAIY